MHKKVNEEDLSKLTTKATSKRKEIKIKTNIDQLTVEKNLENQPLQNLLTSENLLPNIEKKSQRLKNKKNNQENNTDNFDQKHSVINKFREENLSQHRPPKGSLSELVFLNKLEILELKLLEEDAEPNNRDNSGATSSWTPLYWAVKLVKYEAVKILLEHGSNINLVINDIEECCGTVLDLATLRGDEDMENLLREFGEKESLEFGQSFKAIRTKLRGKAPAFNFRYYGKKKLEAA